MTEDTISPLEVEFRAELPRILRMSDSDLDGALAAMDRYLDREPSSSFRKSLLAWKGRFYLEHKRYEDAVRVLRLADGSQASSDLQTFNTKLDLATALKESHDKDGAYEVLMTGLVEVGDAVLSLRLLRALVDVAASTGRSMPTSTGRSLQRVAQFYGMDPLPEEEDSAALVVWLDDLARDCGVRFDHLRCAVRRAETAAEKERLVAEYIESVSIPYFKEQAKDALRRWQ